MACDEYQATKKIIKKIASSVWGCWHWCMEHKNQSEGGTHWKQIERFVMLPKLASGVQWTSPYFPTSIHKELL